MSLRVEALNADSTFLLTFSPPFVASKPSPRCPPDYTILLDPWLGGASSILHPAFQISHHRSTPYVRPVEDLHTPPDLIVISQDRPDHCHKDTLCSLPNSWRRTNLLAPASAVKKIQSWKHFDPQRVHILPAYHAEKDSSVIRIPVPGCSPSGVEGEITITNVVQKADMAGLHTAVGITYQPASTVLTQKRSDDDDETPTAEGINGLARHQQQTAPVKLGGPVQRLKHHVSTKSLRKAFKSETNISSSHVRSDSAMSMPFLEAEAKNFEEVLSVIYSPHGVTLDTLRPYIAGMLTPLRALPVTLLLHSIIVEKNPWFMGGIVCNGAPGGVEIAKAIGARHWISAHDEAKDNKGFATKFIKSRRYALPDVKDFLEEAKLETAAHWLGPGESLTVRKTEGLWTEATAR